MQGGNPELRTADMLTGGAESRAKQLSEWVRSKGLGGSAAVLTLESGTYGLFQVDKPAVPEKELRSAIRWTIKNFIDYPPDQATLDVFSVPDGRRGPASTLYVAAVRRSLLKERIALIENAGLHIARIDITELALRNLAGCFFLKENEAQAILYFQESRGWLLICKQGEFYLSRNLDYGQRQISGGNQDLEMTIDNMDMMERVTLEIQRTMDYYDSHFGLAPIKQVGILTEAVRAEELAAYTQSNLGVSTSALTLKDIFQAPLDSAFEQKIPGWIMGGALGELLPDNACWFFHENT